MQIFTNNFTKKYHQQKNQSKNAIHCNKFITFYVEIYHTICISKNISQWLNILCYFVVYSKMKNKILTFMFLVFICWNVYWEDLDFYKSDSLDYVPWEVIVKYKDLNYQFNL